MTVLNPVTYGWLGGVKVVAAALFRGAVGQSGAFAAGAVRHTLCGWRCSWGQAFWAAGLLLALFCNAAPAPFSFLYWFCGAVAYQIPLIGLLNFTALALRAGWGPAAAQWRNAGLGLPAAGAGPGRQRADAGAGRCPCWRCWAMRCPAPPAPSWWLWLVIGAAGRGRGRGRARQLGARRRHGPAHRPATTPTAGWCWGPGPVFVAAVSGQAHGGAERAGGGCWRGCGLG